MGNVTDSMQLTAKLRNPLFVRIGAALLLYVAGLWIAINFGHYADLAQRRGCDLRPHRWKPHTAEACFVVSTVMLAFPLLRACVR